MDSRKAWRMDIAERTNNTIQQDKQHIPTGPTTLSSRTNNIIQQDKQHIPAGQTKKSSRTNNIKTSIRK
ncbi:MAG: hypothetical protein MSA32_05190 [Bacteroidales bacterium]|nr:hypothetical protein [Bacteroidales bacterium]